MTHKDEKKQHPHEHGNHPEKPKDPKTGPTPQDDPGGTGGVGGNDPDADGDDDSSGIENPGEPPGNP